MEAIRLHISFFPLLKIAHSLPAAPSRSTFASLARAGAVSSFGTTARVAAWVVGTTALSATLREGARLGPRYTDYREVDAVTFLLPSFAVNAISGAATARLLGTARIPVIVAAFAVGPLLPYALAQSSAYTQRSLRRLSGQLSGAAPGQG